MFVNLPVHDLERSKAFFTSLGLAFYGATEDMASVIINDDTQVMLLAEATFAGYVHTEVGDPAKSTQVILVLGLENRTQVDELVGNALAAGATAVGDTRESNFRYQRGFTDLDGHHWEALCLEQPTG
jgi:predicted lactoylglutathione lyase